MDESCFHCGKMTISELRTRLCYLKRGGVPLPLLRSSSRLAGSQARTTSGSGTGGLRVTVMANPPVNQPLGDHRSSCTPQPVELPKERAWPSARSIPAVSFGAPLDERMSIAASEGEPELSIEEDPAALPPSGIVARPESNPEKHPATVPFFLEVYEELTRSWTAPFTARNQPASSSTLTTLDGGAAKGYTEILPVKQSVVMQLCPNTASTWRDNPSLPSRACRYSSGLTGSAYVACGGAASALHPMALLQVHQAKSLRWSRSGGSERAPNCN